MPIVLYFVRFVVTDVEEENGSDSAVVGGDENDSMQAEVMHCYVC